MDGVLSSKGYERLLGELGELIAAGKREAESQAGHILAVTYWKVGERLGREQLSERAGYGDGVIERLADELGIAHTTLKNARKFASTYPQPPEPGLSWAHYRELLTVADPKVRAFYEKAALQQGWTKRQLHDQIAGRTYETGGEPKERALKRPTDADYLYRCEVTRVVDGDTLVVEIDLGFGVQKEERVRLKAVDAPEAKTRAGKKAAQWVRERLAAAEQVVIKTVRIELHGRYVAHVFYSGDGEASIEGVFRSGGYLNGELVAEGLAKQVR